MFSLIRQDIFIRKVLSFTVFLATDIAQFYDSCQNQMRQRLTLTQGLEARTKPPPLLTHDLLKGQIEFQPLHLKEHRAPTEMGESESSQDHERGNLTLTVHTLARSFRIQEENKASF